jgi:hypothetical protein
MPSELFNSDGGTAKTREEAPESVSNIDPAVQEATMPDIGGLARGRVGSGVLTGGMAKAVGAPTGAALKAGVKSAFNPAGIMLAMADEMVPGMLSQGPTQRNFEGAVSEVDPTGSRGVRDTMNAVAQNRGTRTVDQGNLDRLRAMGFDDYVSVDRELQAGRMASRPFTTQIKDAIADPLEKGIKSMFGITEKEDLDRMIANDPAAMSAMKDPTGGTGTSAPSQQAQIGRGPGSPAHNAFSAYGGRDFGGRDGGGNGGDATGGMGGGRGGAGQGGFGGDEGEGGFGESGGGGRGGGHGGFW